MIYHACQRICLDGIDPSSHLESSFELSADVSAGNIDFVSDDLSRQFRVKSRPRAVQHDRRPPIQDRGRDYTAARYDDAKINVRSYIGL